MNNDPNSNWFNINHVVGTRATSVLSNKYCCKVKFIAIQNIFMISMLLKYDCGIKGLLLSVLFSLIKSDHNFSPQDTYNGAVK